MRKRLAARALLLYVFVTGLTYASAGTEVCTNSMIPGDKGDQGEVGDGGEEGKLGKTGPPGSQGLPGERGLKGEVGRVGKMGRMGDEGAIGDSGFAGPPGPRGNPGATCDCGRYRKVVGHLDATVGKLGNAVKFVKNVILGLRETEERYYLLVKEPRRFREALMNCKLRGGVLAMPQTRDTNRLLADYVSHAGLPGIYIGLQAQDMGAAGVKEYIFADSTPLRGFSAWAHREELGPTAPPAPPSNSTCVGLLSTGTWTAAECDAAMFYVCEFPKSSRRGGGGGGGRGGGGGGGVTSAGV